jgi:hypothetical protein
MGDFVFPKRDRHRPSPICQLTLSFDYTAHNWLMLPRVRRDQPSHPIRLREAPWSACGSTPPWNLTEAKDKRILQSPRVAKPNKLSDGFCVPTNFNNLCNFSMLSGPKAKIADSVTLFSICYQVPGLAGQADRKSHATPVILGGFHSQPRGPAAMFWRAKSTSTLFSTAAGRVSASCRTDSRRRA